MNRQFFNYLLILWLMIACFTLHAGAQTMQAVAKLQQYSIKIGDQTKLFLVMHQPTKEHVDFPQLTDTITGKIQVVSSNKPDTVFELNDHSRATITKSYTITCFDEGTYTIPAFSIGTSGGVLKTNELTLQVQTVKVDTTKSIYDIKQPLAVSYSFFDWLRDHWVWVLAGLIIILLIIGVTWYLAKRPKNIPLIREVKPAMPAHAIALSKLQELRDKKLWQREEVKLYHSELTDVLREYLEKRYLVPTHEKTTDEILVAVKRVDITEENRNKLRQILLLADLVKFAKEKPLPVENEQSMDNAIDFVVKTQPPQIIETPKTAEGGDVDANV